MGGKCGIFDSINHKVFAEVGTDDFSLIVSSL